jgi:hypothetical protein
MKCEEERDTNVIGEILGVFNKEKTKTTRKS